MSAWLRRLPCHRHYCGSYYYYYYYTRADCAPLSPLPTHPAPRYMTEIAKNPIAIDADAVPVKGIFAPAPAYVRDEVAPPPAPAVPPSPLPRPSNSDDDGSVRTAPAGAALSKLLEYGMRPSAVAALLADPTVDLEGRDAYGLAAVHKFASWNEVEHLAALAARLSTAALNARSGGGTKAAAGTAYHYAQTSGAAEASAWLWANPRFNHNC